MSNTNVGVIYQQIIRDVVESSRVDFEEGGVEESVLDELSKGWQQKLSQLGVAQFPWDPKPDPAPPAPAANPPPPSSNNSSFQQSASPASTQTTAASSQPPSQAAAAVNNGPRIKTEPGLENGSNVSQASFPSSGSMTAQQRAAQHLQASYGDRASASIGAIRAGMSQQAGQQGQPQQQFQAQTPKQIAMYQQALAQKTAQQRAQVNQNGVGSAQIDGAGDLDTEQAVVLTHVDSSGLASEMGRLEIDEMIRQKIESMGKRMEGGGLMLPLSNKKATKDKKRKTAVRRSDDVSVSTSETSQGPAQAPRALQQFDGFDDDDEDEKVLDDEDAINSELDDSDDGLNDDDDDDEGMGHIMLCMYDKVQRVKNKWKCVMKDGVLTVNNKEYVFHKATGEYEW